MDLSVPLDLQSNALPLSYTPSYLKCFTSMTFIKITSNTQIPSFVYLDPSLVHTTYSHDYEHHLGYLWPVACLRTLRELPFIFVKKLKTKDAPTLKYAYCLYYWTFLS